MPDYANLYATPDDFRTAVGAAGTMQETRIVQVLHTASRWVDRKCQRRFFVVASEVRYFTPTNSRQLVVGDFTTLTSLLSDEDGDRTYEITWDIAGADADVDFYPDNAVAEGRPYWKLVVTPDGSYSFPRIRRGVQATGSFGYCALEDRPAEIFEATVEKALQLLKRPEAPFGVATFGELGAMRVARTDPGILDMLEPFMLAVVA